MKSRMRFLLIIIVLASFSELFGQVGVGTTTPDPSSVLDVKSETQGMLTPRMTTTQRTAISSPAKGLLVFDTDLNAFHFFDGANWIKISSENNSNDYTGWADYVDQVYTSGSPLTLAANTKITLPNNANRVVDFQKPIDISTFYDSAKSVITGRNGDGINVVIEFKIRPIVNQTTKITVAIDIGGAVGEIYKRDFITSKGLNVEHYYLSSFSGYTLDTFEQNGGKVKIVSDYATEIYDIRYVITRTHKAR